MNIEFHSNTTLHLSVPPTIKSWSILFGVISMGIGAACYSPDEHPLLKIAYLCGCLIIGLHYFDDWEDCVIDQIQKKITLTRRNWLEILTSRCTVAKTLVLDSNSVMAVQVSPAKSNTYQVELILRNGSNIPISETTSSKKSHEEMLADCIIRILGLDRMETFHGIPDDSDDDTHSMSTVSHVENLHRSIYTEYEGKREEENGEESFDESDNANLSSSDDDDEESVRDD